MAGEANAWNPRTLIDIDGDFNNPTQRFVATEGQTTFTLTEFAYVVGAKSLEIYINGLFKDILVDFTETSDTVFELATGATVGDIVTAVGNVGFSSGDAELQTGYAQEWAENPEDDPVSVEAGGDAATTFSALHHATKTAVLHEDFDTKYLGSKAADPTLDNSGNALLKGAWYWNITNDIVRIYDGSLWHTGPFSLTQLLTTYEYTATNGQTAFSGVDDNGNTLAYIAGVIISSLNGNILDSDDYTATDGTSFNLAVGAAIDDVVSISAFSTFDIADVYTKTETYTQAEIDTFVDARAFSGRGALIYHSTTQSIPDNILTTATFDSEEYDTDAIHDLVTNPERLTVPAGITEVKVHALMDFAANITGFRAALIQKNGGAFVGAPTHNGTANSAGTTTTALSSPTLHVTGGDYFELDVQQDSGGALSLLGGTGGIWFAMELIK